MSKRSAAGLETADQDPVPGLREIGQRITRAIDPDDQPVPAAMPAQAPQ